MLSISPSAITLGLRKMRELLRVLGHPERRFRSVVVAGTNGKGTVTAYLSAILTLNGRRVGWYSSPHIYDVTERIRIDQVPVSIDDMEAAAARIVPYYDEIGYSYFEALTAIAFLIFAEKGVEFAVLETGLGGRFDATNTVEPEVSVITSISLDHRRILGDSEEEILREKLGIARGGVPLLVGRFSEALQRIIEEAARQRHIVLQPVDSLGCAEARSMDFDGMHARVRTARRDYGSVRIPFVGEHQLVNAILAIGAAESLIGSVERLDMSAADVGIAARFQVIRAGGKRVILDVAHNDAALSATGKTLATLSPPEDNAIVLGLLARKELGRFPENAGAFARRYYFVHPVADESVPSAHMLHRFGFANLRDRGVDVVMAPFIEKAAEYEHLVDSLLAAANPAMNILVTGSHRTIEHYGRFFERRRDRA